jgi:hypothetical protein
MSTHRANRISDPRLLQAMRDPGVEMIERAARTCHAAGHRRANLIAGRMQWPKAFVSLVDELILDGVPSLEILVFCEAVAEAGRQRVYQGTGIPSESVGEALALESIAEGEANRDAAKLIDSPRCPSRLRALWDSLTFHQTRIDHARRVIARDMAGNR